MIPFPKATYDADQDILSFEIPEPAAGGYRRAAAKMDAAHARFCRCPHPLGRRSNAHYRDSSRWADRVRVMARRYWLASYTRRHGHAPE